MMELRDKLSAARAKSKKLAALSTVLLSVLSVMLMYLLFLSADNHRLVTALNRTKHNETALKQAHEEEEGEDDLLEDMDSDWLSLTPLSNTSLLLLRPHYSLFGTQDAAVSVFTNDMSSVLSALWLCSPYSIYLLLLKQHGVSPSLVVAAYVLFLLFVIVLRRLAPRHTRWTRLFDWTPRKWFRGVLLRTAIIVFLCFHVTMKQYLAENIVKNISNAFVLLFISACFFSGKSFLALMWALLVSFLTQLAPFFRSSFLLPWCPWIQGGVCQIEVGEFFVVSEFLLFVFSPIRIVIN